MCDLRKLLCALFCYRKDLNYVQGFNDVAALFLSIFSIEESFILLNQFSEMFLR